MTVNNLQGYSTIASLSKCIFL